MTKNKIRIAGIFFLIFLSAGMPAVADTFSGMVVDASVYGLVVKNANQARLFQIRPSTKGDKQPRPEDLVRVAYHRDPDSGALVADQITITKRYLP